MNFKHPHHHLFKPSPAGQNRRVFLLLHGTGGNEHDLIPLARSIDPDSAVLGVRGNVLEHGMPRFFRRLAEGVFDEADLVQRAGDLAGFIREASEEYQFDTGNLVAMGYSNGANIASAVHLLHPGLIRKSIHLRPMTPFEPDSSPDLKGVQLFLSFGAHDSLMPAGESEKLPGIFRKCGAKVTVNIEPAGHQLVRNDIEAAASWLKKLY